MSAPLDLLYRTPSHRVALPVVERALVFAFSAGDTARAFERVIENATCGVSSFRAEHFAADLFVSEFIDRCLPIHVNGQRFTPCKPYLLKVLTAPPADPADIAFRQHIQQELLANPSLRAALEALYVELCSLRTLLSSGDFSSRLDPNIRRLDILRALSQLFVQLAAGFTQAKSGLAALSQAGERVLASEAFARLRELLEYEQHSATIDLRVQVGLDGSIRAFDVLGHRENNSNRFHQSWLVRCWDRLGLMLRGYRVGRQEILSRLLDQTFEGLKAEVLPLFQLLADIELHLGGLALVDTAARTGLRTCFAEWNASAEEDSVLRGLFNPFLLAEGVAIRTCDVQLPNDSIVVVTGPNSGGKTRLLQSVALVQLLAQGGLAVPAAKAQLALRRGLFVSLLNEVRPDQAEGRLGMELLRIRHLFEQIELGDMVVIDELCSGTNPSEGEEIFRLVVELLGQLKPQIWLTTHFLQFAEELRSSSAGSQLRFLQVKLDAGDHPTFEFEEGVARTSLARQTAARLGVTREELAALVERAKSGARRVTSD